MDISLIATLVVVFYALLYSLVHMLKARKRSWIMAVVDLVGTVLMAILSIPVTKWVAERGVERGYDYFCNYFRPELTSYLESVPLAADGLRVLIALVISPILYLLVFMVMRLILSVIMKILVACVPSLKERKLQGVSMPVGAVNGLLIALVMLIPLCGYICLAANLLDTADETGILESPVVQEVLPEDVRGNVDTLYEMVGCHPVVTTVHKTVGQPIFKALTTEKMKNENTHGSVVELNLEREADGLLVTASHALEVLEALEGETFTEADKEEMFAAADCLLASDWIRMVASDSLVSLSEAWLQEQTFAGVARPALDATLDPTVDCILHILETETPDALGEDIHLLLDVVGDLLISDLLNNTQDYAAMVKMLGEGGILSNALNKLEANEHFRPLADELKTLAIRLVSNMLGVDQLMNGEYAEMMEEVAASLTDALAMSEAERDAWVLESIQTNFADKGYDVPEDVALEISHQVMDELGADGVITAEELTDYLVNHGAENMDIVEDIIDPDMIPEDGIIGSNE